MGEILKDDLREIKDYTVYSKQTVFPFDVFGETGKGGRSENQDSFWFGDTSYGLLLIVCDGMGGGPGGRTASTLAVQEIGNYVNQHSKLKPRDVVIGSVLNANKTLYTYAQQHTELMGMGSTCVVALLTDQNAVVCHIGDSRFYQFRKHHELFHTFDHSQVFEMVRNGIINEEEARVSSFSNVITKGLGLRMDLKIDINPDSSSDILEIPYRKGDRFVLCTDGIHGVLPMSVLTKELTMAGDVESIVNGVHSKINMLGVNSGNQHDNLTLLVAVAKVDSQLSEEKRPPKYIPPKNNSRTNWRKILMILIPIIIVLLAFCVWHHKKIDVDYNENDSISTMAFPSDSNVIRQKDVVDNKALEEEKDYNGIIKGTKVIKITNKRDEKSKNVYNGNYKSNGDKLNPDIQQPEVGKNEEKRQRRIRNNNVTFTP